MKPVDKEWGVVKPKPLTKRRIMLACLEETIKELPRIQYRLNEISSILKKLFPMSNHDSVKFHHENFSEEQIILSEEYAMAMVAKDELVEMTGRWWADYIHNQATLEFYSKLK